MLETKQQKQSLVTVLVLIIILGLVSFWSKPQFGFEDPTNRQAIEDAFVKNQEAYKKYLASINTTPEAQEKLFKEIVPESEVRMAVEEQLNIKQKIVIPVIANTQLKITSETGKVALEKYISSSSPIIDKIKNGVW